ncbi:MAG: hypothetical protein WA632_00720 [Gallionella sp.]
MTRISYRMLFLLLAFIVLPQARGDDAAKPSREEVQQEMQLVKMLLTNSPLADHSKSSGGDKVKEPIELARSLYERASDALKDGNLVWATAFLDEALGLIEDAARLGADPQQVETKQREHYSELLDDVRAFDATYRDVRKDMSAKDTKNYDSQIEPTNSILTAAQKLAREGKYVEASEQLEKVHAIYISVLNELLASTAFVYDKNFKTPLEEFEYEMARYHSYEELMPIARDQFKPDEYTLKLSDQFVQDAHTAHAVAEKQAAGGDHTAAIKTLQEATKKLQTALRTIGLEVPE